MTEPNETNESNESSPTTSCQSCTMTIESGDYCQYCSDAAGKLLPFAETFERFLQFSMQRDPGLDRATAAAQTLQFMSERPAWSHNAELLAAREDSA